MKKSEREILGAMLLYGPTTAYKLIHTVKYSYGTIQKILKRFYDLGICKRKMGKYIREYTYSVDDSFLLF